jgi:hypothetical protein
VVTFLSPEGDKNGRSFRRPASLNFLEIQSVFLENLSSPDDKNPRPDGMPGDGNAEAWKIMAISGQKNTPSGLTESVIFYVAINQARVTLPLRRHLVQAYT